jgi:hypothetical protein
LALALPMRSRISSAISPRSAIAPPLQRSILRSMSLASRSSRIATNRWPLVISRP